VWAALLLSAKAEQAVFVLAVALIVWTNLHDFRTEDQFAHLGFLDALYYAGVTVTVLGYGDITPLRGPAQIVAFVASGTGSRCCGIVTYLVQLVESMSRHNRLALAVLSGSGGSGRRSALPVRYLRSGSVQALAVEEPEPADGRGSRRWTKRSAGRSESTVAQNQRVKSSRRSAGRLSASRPDAGARVVHALGP
jgi:hypothetical protein